MFLLYSNLQIKPISNLTNFYHTSRNTHQTPTKNAKTNQPTAHYYFKGPIVEIKYANGSKYKGQTKKGLKYGFGEHTFKNGSTLKGYFYNDKPAGNATLINPDGSKLEANWVNSKQEGQAKFYYEDGESVLTEWSNGVNLATLGLRTKLGQYKGQLKGLKRHGHGQLEYSIDKENYHSYIGNWKDDFRHGKGKEICSVYIYEGDWKNDIREGYGKIEFVNSIPQKFYKGQMSDNLPNGNGVIYYEDGSYRSGFFQDGNLNDENCEGMLSVNQTFKGICKNDLLNGYVEIFDNGEVVYKGNYQNDKADGNGELLLENKDFYKGNFVSGVFQGLGEYTNNADSYKLKGIFNDGKIIGEVIVWKDCYMKRGKIVAGNFQSNDGEVEFSLAKFLESQDRQWLKSKIESTETKMAKQYISSEAYDQYMLLKNIIADM